MPRLVPFVLVIAVVAGCGKSSSRAPGTSISVSTATSTAATTTTRAAPPPPTLVRVYFLRDEGKINPVGRAVPGTRAVAFAALEQLFAGPTAHERAAGFTSAIPINASPGAVTIVDDVAVIDLPRLSHAALAQVVYTLTQFPTMRGVRTARSIGDTKPLTPADFEDVTPQILIEDPLPDEHVTSPLRVRGTANTFEATFVLELHDASGKTLAHRVVTATSGSGERGTFETTLRFSGAPAVLGAWEPSAENGKPLHEVVIPVR